MVLQKKGRNVVVPGQLVTALADLVSPRFCFHCESRLPPGDMFLCSNCLANIPVLSDSDLYRISADHFPDGVIDKLIAVSEFSDLSPLRALIHSLKYFDGFNIGVFLGAYLGKVQKNLFNAIEIDIIIPIPLHRLRLIERGYNQSLEIAKGLAEVLGKPIDDRAAFRQKATHQQVTSTDRHERQMNMKGAFTVESPLRVAGKNILVVDDVITTGATVRALALELMRSGASSVHAASILVR